MKSILERISASIQSITDLAQAATEGVSQADSSLGGMVGLSSDTSGLVGELSGSSKTLAEIVHQMEGLLNNLSHGERPAPVAETMEASAASEQPLPAEPAPVPAAPDLKGMLPEETPSSLTRGTAQESMETEEIEELESAED